MINKHLVKEFKCVTHEITLAEKSVPLDTHAQFAKKRGTQPDLLRPPSSYVRTRKLPAIAVAASIPPTSTAVTIAVCHRFGLIHGERAAVKLGPV
jgi:hypothetical protein